MNNLPKNTFNKIHAWIRNPKNNLFKGMSKKCALFVLHCSNQNDCDLYKNEKSCLNCGGGVSCKFGKKTSQEGPTKESSRFYKTMDDWREENKEYLGSLTKLRAYNRIFYACGHYYFPYSFMVKNVFGRGYPLEDTWVKSTDVTTELLEKICVATPHAEMGGEIKEYQEKQVPKFISDLKMFYPELFELLPQQHKDRIKEVSYVGRTADITTCPPCHFVISSTKYEWDGKYLKGESTPLQPVNGKVTIEPNPREPVKITSDSQVSDDTRFLD